MDKTAHVDPVQGTPDHPELGARGALPPPDEEGRSSPVATGSGRRGPGSGHAGTATAQHSRACLVGGFRPCLVAATGDRAPSRAITSQICAGEARCRRDHAAVLADQQTSEAQLRRRRGLGKGGERLTAASLGTSRVALGGERRGGQIGILASDLSDLSKSVRNLVLFSLFCQKCNGLLDFQTSRLPTVRS